MRRSRIFWSPVRRKSSQSCCVSSARVVIARENTAFSGGLLSPSATAPSERARRKGGEPCRNRGGSGADDDAPGVLPARERVGGDGRQRGCENGEQDPERVPLHAPSLLRRRRLLARG